MSSLVQLKAEQIFYGQVVKGKQLGRTIGFPTANVQLETNVFLEKGVYGVFVYHENKRYVGVMNVGNRPTFNDGHHETYEVHILDFNDDIYHQQLSVDIKFYIRPEKKFQQLTDLMQQIQADVFRTRKLFRSIYHV